MSTLQHTPQQAAFRNRLALVVIVAGAIAALTVALIASSNGPSSWLGISRAAQVHPSQAQIQRELAAVSGPRYGLVRPASGAPARTETDSQRSQRQLQAVAGARYRQPVGIHARR